MSEEKSVTLKSVVERQKQFFDTDTTKSVAYRIRMLSMTLLNSKKTTLL